MTGIFLGKGLILPINLFKLFLQKNYLSTIKKKLQRQKNKSEYEILNKILSNAFGPGIECCPLGHDAFDSLRDGFTITGDLANQEYIKTLETLNNHLAEIEFDEDINFLSDYLGLGGGYYMYLGSKPYDLTHEDDEFSTRVNAVEIINGIAGLIPKIIKHYPVISNKKFVNFKLFLPILELKKINDKETTEDLETIRENALFYMRELIWTFTPDCHCCG